MSTPWLPAPPSPISPSHGRRSHLSVASLATNASAFAESTISQGTAWTTESIDTVARISQFPPPPSTIPTPTASLRSGASTPTSAHSPIASLRKSISTSLSIPSQLNSPIFPESPHYDFRPGPSDASTRSIASITSAGGATAVNTTAPLTLHKRSAYTAATPAVSPVSPDNTKPPYPPVPSFSRNDIVEPRVQKRPPSPSTLAGSSIYDWSDGVSSVSINTGEERLLSTTFITSLLNQTRNPFADAEGPPTAWKRSGRDNSAAKATDGSKNDSPTEAPSSSNPTVFDVPKEIDLTEDTRDFVKPRPSHQSIPHSIGTFEVFSPPPPIRADEHPTSSNRQPEAGSFASTSRRNSTDYSETLHSEEQVHSLVRSPSIIGKMVSARAIAITPAYRVSYAGGNSERLSSSARAGASGASSPSSSFSPVVPPFHRADAPVSVKDYPRFPDTPRESEEDYMAKARSMSLDVDRFEWTHSSDQPQSPALPSTSGSHQPGNSPRRASGLQHSRSHSMKSAVSSLVSRISNSSSARRSRYMAWLTKRPLPPLPPMPRRHPGDHSEVEIQKYDEEDIPLPTLAKRAAALGEMLDENELPAGVSLRTNSHYYKERQGDSRGADYNAQDRYAEVDAGVSRQGSRYSRGRSIRRPFRTWMNESLPALPTLPPAASAALTRHFRRPRIILLVCLIIGLVMAITLPVSLSHRKHSPQPERCAANRTGFDCTLDATCICTSSIAGGPCKPLAKSILDLIPSVNNLFHANFSGSSFSDALFNAQGSPRGNDCSTQAVLIDVEPGLDQTQFPKRTAWAQSVILWNLELSQDINATTVLQSFVSKEAPWSSLDSDDVAEADTSGRFSVQASGIIFDFAAQSVSPVPTTFKDNANPTSDQLAKLTAPSNQILDRMYSYAQASSIQRSRSLRNYWTSTLQQQANDLSKFIGAIISSPFFLPFDATSSPGNTPLTTLMTNSSTSAFPPPLACYPALTSTQLDRVNALETSVFGLSKATSVSNFDSACFPNRPVYGTVDVLRLRLPFTSNRQGAARQASLLSGDAQKRAVIYSGEVLSALPGVTSVPALTNATSDPREFGTSNNFNHVLLNYLSSITDISLAMELVQFVLDGSSTPPSNSSRLFSSLSAIPVLEFAVFGLITPSDLISSVSSFSTPNGTLFFGSNAGQRFRSWALIDSPETIAWAESDTSPQVVREGSARNDAFESVWNPASQLIRAGPTDGTSVGRVTSSLQSLGLFTS